MREMRFWDPKSSQNPDGFKSLAIQPETYAVLSYIFDQTLELENPPPHWHQSSWLFQNGIEFKQAGVAFG